MHHGPAPTPHQDRLLEHRLIALLGDDDGRASGLLREQLESVEIACGSVSHLPVDVMRNVRGIGCGIGVDPSARQHRRKVGVAVAPRA